MNRRAFGLAAFLLLACGLGLAGGWLLLTSYKPYDDEGYVLWSLVNFAHGGRLYAEIYTQYGPFFYWWNDALHTLLRFDFNHLAARGLTLVYWLGAALCCAWIVDHRTRSRGWGLLALAATFAHLWQMTAEPGHPGGLIAFFVALGAWGGAECIARDRHRGLAVIVGLVGAALALTKINVGLFFFAGAGAWLLLNIREPRLQRPARWLAAGALGLLPWLLMRALLGQAWVVTFAVVGASAALGATLAAQATRRPTFSLADGAWLAGSAAAVVAIVTGLLLARGGSLADLIEGVVRGPLRHPHVYFFAITWQPGTLALAALSLAGCGVAHARRWTEHPAFADGVAWARLGLLVVAGFGWFGRLPISSLGLAMNFGLPAVWLLVIPLRRDAGALESSRIRSWLGLLLVTQALHAYPVGGSQIGWGTFLWVPLLILAAAEAVALLQPRTPSLRWLAPAGGLTAFALAAIFAHVGSDRWRTSEPLRLPGAESMRLPELLSARLRALTLNATVHADHLFSLPGLYSFNLWSGRPTPTPANATHWFSLLNPAQQTAIEQSLAADPRAVIVVDSALVNFIRRGGLPVAGPLYDYLGREFRPALTVGNYELWCKRGRTIAPLSTAHLYRARDPVAEKFQLKIRVYTAPGARVASVDWVECSDYALPRVCHVLNQDNCRLEFTPLYPNGEAAGPATPAPLPAALPRFVQLTFFSNQPLSTWPRRAGVLRLRDPAGALVAEAIFAD